jgi:transposase-like protein
VIKLICPECGSDKIFYFDNESEEEKFKCDDCGEEFTIKETEWQSE